MKGSLEVVKPVYIARYLSGLYHVPQQCRDINTNVRIRRVMFLSSSEAKTPQRQSSSTPAPHQHRQRGSRVTAGEVLRTMDGDIPLPQSNTTSFFSTSQSTPRRPTSQSTPRRPERRVPFYNRPSRNLESNISSISENSHLESHANSYKMHSFNAHGDVEEESWTRHAQWGPGGLLNGSGRVSQREQAIASSLCLLFQQIERSMESTFQELDRRMTTIEKKVALFEANLCSSSPGSHVSSSHGSSGSSSGTSRRKRSPPDLQSKIRTLHSNLDETNQFNCHERIDGEHNSKVISIIINELSSEKDYSKQQIKDGCRIYKKTLQSKEKDKSLETIKRTRIRSRQQRLFDRRNRVVVNSQSSQLRKLWKYVTAEMMTEEESDDDGGFVRHRQSWRSDEFNDLMEHLDKGKKETLAKNRRDGEIVERAPPPYAEMWMIANCSAGQLQTTESNSSSSDNGMNELVDSDA
ncbi:uncharacterized protein [Dysidea avara]|uniref:uncharacterized protein isoform X2 n=1 Tax=Dysidea avara TaxID=196820 RepID=UPI003321CFCE